MTTFLSPNEIIDDILKNQLKSEQIKEFQAIPEDDLIMLHHGFGMWIRNHYLLWDSENPHTDGSDAQGDKFPDQVSQAIIEKMWKMVTTLEKYK